MSAIWHTFDTPAAQATALADAIAGWLQTAIERDGTAALAVSGGKSPIALFEALAQTDLDWSRVTVTLVDERIVPAGHPDSNARLVREHLLVGRAAAARFVPLVTDPADPESDLERLEHALPKLTVAVLGMGEDGHTASLFPDAAGLAEGLAPDSRHRIIAITPPNAPHRRLTLTLAELARAEARLLAIGGQAKRAVATIAESDAQHYPVGAFFALPLTVYWSP
ncbi:6-phosphogluconolactonase [Crenobacter sp. SG2305]|uniref:6-phosphogluconolactonase n=1 Tax=Crenobacter oryzisoli TaxID=3056844 RepID=UPI0025AACA4E|nr:6-phosphogluconolactonase [Crenobacter sp. SG2305]MDN0081225.1 6-phosphogluconolactonase [Crenobacter sp. SG2305]